MNRRSFLTSAISSAVAASFAAPPAMTFQEWVDGQEIAYGMAMKLFHELFPISPRLTRGELFKWEMGRIAFAVEERNKWMAANPNPGQPKEDELEMIRFMRESDLYLPNQGTYDRLAEFRSTILS